MRTRKLPLWIYTVPIVTAFALPNMGTPLMELWRNDIGFSSGTLVLIFATYLGGLAPAFLFSPALGQLFGQKKTQIAAIASGILACIFYALGGSVEVLLIARVLTGFCAGVLMVLGTTQLKDLAKEGEETQATLLGTLGIAIGLATGPLFAGVVAEWFPHPLRTVYVLAATFLLLSLAIVFTLPETENAKPQSWNPIGSLDKNTTRAVLTGLGVFGPGMTAASIVLALAPTILLGMSDLTGPLVAGLFAGGMYLASPITQSFLGSQPPLRVLRGAIAVLITSMVTFVAALWIENLWILALAAVLIGAGQGMGSLGALGLVHQRATPEHVASATASLSLGVYLSAAFVPLLGGVILDHSDLQIAGAAMGLGVVAMCLAGMFMVRERFLTPDSFNLHRKNSVLPRF
ncbi:MFS transporter [Corynebacterium auriscanis]|uniref:MFS transporter n=1 Tax=Corynebacterium auriscanis TaxID=99807 RepID=UPI003CEFFFD4